MVHSRGCEQGLGSIELMPQGSHEEAAPLLASFHLPVYLLIPAPAALRSVVGKSLCLWDCVFESCREISMKLGELWVQGSGGRGPSVQGRGEGGINWGSG